MLLCVALLAVLWPLVSTVQVCAITGYKLDMSKLQLGYDWMKCFVCLEANEDLVCNTGKWEQLSCIGYNPGGVTVFSASEEHESQQNS